MAQTITILGTGGTIASTDETGGAKPSKNSEALVEAVPQLADYADLDVREVAQRPSFDMDIPTLEELRQAIEGAVEDDADGILVTHGTDTMEESAYYLDLTLDVGVPVVFSGAQRRPDEVSPDGPANLFTAVRVLTDDRIRNSGGVYIAFDEELHAARDVTKRHTRKLDAFESPEKGPVAVTTRGAVRWYREPGSYSVTLDGTGEPSDIDVRMVTSGVGVGGDQIEDALDAGVDGLVVEGTGLGNTTAAVGNAIEQAVSAGVPVVVTSRCYAGSTAAVYGTDGGGQTLADYGAIHGDDLPAHKARLKLRVVLQHVDEASQVRRYFSGYEIQ
ncbi:asparaginase [Haladaptatus cibarius]|uniref:asparaginase n=1 Tax=Haladaptatus cibarius TaxID=453847 RepID=UPI0006797222|nr:asparaginase [Haladaptatus cibarius]